MLHHSHTLACLSGMHITSRQPWQHGDCSVKIRWIGGIEVQVCGAQGVPVLPCMVPGCGDRSCIDCDSIHACDRCYVPMCHDHREHHECPVIGPVIPECEYCDSVVNWGFSHCCEECQTPQCHNQNCSTNIRTTDCRCGRDCCMRCAKWFYGEWSDYVRAIFIPDIEGAFLLRNIAQPYQQRPGARWFWFCSRCLAGGDAIPRRFPQFGR